MIEVSDGLRDVVTLWVISFVSIVSYILIDYYWADPQHYLVTCYSGGEIIFERDGLLQGNELDCGDRVYVLPANCLKERLEK